MDTDGALCLWLLNDNYELCSLISRVAKFWHYRVDEFTTIESAWDVVRRCQRCLDHSDPDYIIAADQLRDGTTGLWLREMRTLFPRSDILCIFRQGDPQFILSLRQVRVVPYKIPEDLLKILAVLNPYA